MPDYTSGDVSPVAAARRTGSVRSSAWVVAVALAALLITPAVAVTVALGPEPYDKLFQGYPGVDVGVLTSVFNATADLAGVVTVGALVAILFLRDVPTRQARVVDSAWEVQLLQWASGTWMVSAFGMAAMECFDASGSPLARGLEPGAIAFLFEASYAPLAWTVTALGATVTFLTSMFVIRWTGLLIPLWCSVVGLLAPVVTGQVLVGPDHDFGGDSAALQTLAVAVLGGTWLVSAVRVGLRRMPEPEFIRRHLRIAFVALPVIAVTDAIITVFKLAGTSLTASVTGWLIMGRWVFFALLVVATVVVARRWKSATLRAEHVVTASALGAFGTVGWIALTVAMTRQPPPQYFVPTSIEQVFMGFEVPDPPSLAVLFGQWRPNILFLVLAAVGITAYLVALSVLRRRGDAWPAGRTASWILGWVIVVVATSSGFGKYSAADFGIHMIVHMSLNMLAPGLLVLGGVLTLMLRASRSMRNEPSRLHDWITWVMHWGVLTRLYNPLIVFVVFIGSYYGLYLTPIFGDFMRFHWAHQLMNLHFLIVGYLYYSLIVGVDRAPNPLPHIGKLGYVLAAMPFHAFFGVILMTRGVIIAEDFYTYLGIPWANLEAQQYLGGGVAWAGGEIPLLIVIVALCIQWARQDAKDAKRADRHFDTGRDAEYDVYNEMLQRLADRDARAPAPKATRDSSTETERDTLSLDRKDS
ncbi:cytochrome c oxidase assembly protein [Microbacterium sp. SA39]|uniref:cytochrome c oxidase assembly protein n=1 Tax=Microbacterium sp. SA39 TaxID=1263625 RepID=UPI00061EBF69|nr:cytochrome c oxidase assembly protein [Microbacterium sp. SA39]KJQ53181.1 Cytochrome c oxidase caa3 assembly factor [Microbacterium sp. SA39]